jgi:DNA polymerase-4
MACEMLGAGHAKHLAKIASQVAKPDELVVVDPETELDFLHNLPVELMWGMGPVTRARLAEIGVHTIGQLAKMAGYSLERLLGRAAGEKLTALAWNRVHERSERVIEHNRSEPSQRSARSLLKSKFSDLHCVILRTESLAGFGRNPASVGL